MEITRETRLSEILDHYPWIKEEVIKIDSKFKILDTPLAKIMIKKMTIADLSTKYGVDEDMVIKMVNGLIAEHESN